MAKVRLKYKPNFKIEITCDDQDILQSFMDYLRTDKESMRIVFLGGKRIFKPTVISKKLFTKKKNSLTINIGLADYLAFHISSLHKSNDIELEIDDFKAVPITLSQKWTDIFSNHPRGKERGEMQKSDFVRLVRTNTGIAELFTGYGKTELLLSIAECAQQRVVILVPDNHIRDEIISRAGNYGVDLGNYDWSKQINVINVMGFMRSKELNDKAKDWLKDVKVALSDECHHASCDSYQDFFDLLNNLERSHGFSASTDVTDGKKVKAHEVELKLLGPNTAAVVSFCGPVRITRTTAIPVNLVLLRTHIANKEDVAQCSSWSHALDQTLINHKMCSVISRVFEMDRSKTFFIPIHKKESGEVLYYNLIESGYKGIIWTAENYSVNGEERNVKNVLVDIKTLCKKERFDFIMSTKLEGIDIPNLNGVIPLVGSNYRMIVQPIGRSARGDDIVIYLVYDRNNSITISQANNRLDRIMKEYNIISTTRLNL